MELDVVRFFMDVLAVYTIYLILSMSLNLEYGYAGIPNLGKVLFFAIGSFTVASLSLRMVALLRDIEYHSYYAESRALAVKVNGILAQDPLLALALFLSLTCLAMLFSVIAALVLSYPLIRLRGIYLGLTLLLTGEILRYVGRYEENLLGGTLGTPVANFLAWVDPRLRDPALISLYMSIALAVWYLTKRLLQSPYGRLVKAIRDDETAAEILGKNVNRIRVMALALGSAISGLAGALYAFYVGYVDSSDFTPDKTFVAYVMVILGGRANPYGPLAGSLFYVMVDRCLRQVKYALRVPFDLNYLALMLLGITLLIVMYARPKGLFEEKSELSSLHRRALARLSSVQRNLGQADSAKETLTAS